MLAWKDLAVKRTGAAGNRKFYESQNIDTFAVTPTSYLRTKCQSTENTCQPHAFWWQLALIGSHPISPALIKLLPYTSHHPRSNQATKEYLYYRWRYDGVEIAQLLAIFGTKVYLAEIARILPKEEEVGELIERILREDKKVTALTQTRTLSAVKDGLGYRVTFLRGGVEKSVCRRSACRYGSHTKSRLRSRKNASIAYDPTGITTNEHLQTSARHILPLAMFSDILAIRTLHSLSHALLPIIYLQKTK